MPNSMGILGKKVGMTRVYSELGQATPVTVVEAGPCRILQVKNEAKDGYNAIQVGFSEKKGSRVNKPAAGHLKKSNAEGFYFIREFRVSDPGEYAVGQDVRSRSTLQMAWTLNLASSLLHHLQHF